jgi:hypothetical protein
MQCEFKDEICVNLHDNYNTFWTIKKMKFYVENF